MKRINVNFSESAFNDLRCLAERRGKTMSQILRDSIELQRWFDEVRDDGNRVLLERDGNVREVVPR